MSILKDLLTLNEERWSSAVHEKWSPPEGFFKRSGAAIAAGLLRASKDEAQAMARLNFYINRAGKNLDAEDKARLEAAKAKLSAKNESLTEGYNQLSPDEAAEAAEHLQESFDVLHEELNKVKLVLERLPNRMEQTAKSYWFGHMSIALGGQHGYMTAGHEATLKSLIDELQELGHESDEPDYDHDDSEQD